MSKRILSLVLALVMVLGTFGTTFAAETVAETAEKEAAAFLKEINLLKGDDKGNLNLDLKLERRDVVVLLSRLMGEEEVAAKFPVSEESPTWEDARTDAYYTPFFAWAEVNKFFAGKTVKELAPRDVMTAQDYAVVLLRALGYEADGQDAWKAALENAKKLGILADVTVENATEITRGQMSVMTLNALAVNVKDSTKTLAETLNIVLPVPAKLEVVSVSASNLKEVEVEFNQNVDKDSAENKDNYSLNKSLNVESAKLSDNGQQVILRVVTNVVNQENYELTVKNVKADGKALAKTVVEFSPLDVKLPAVESVEALGNKAVKVTFTEPIKDSSVSISDFKINGKAVAGNFDADNGRVIIVKVYNKLADGSHTLEVAKVDDFADYTIVTGTYDFDVVEDTQAPTIESVEATFETVRVTFSESVQNVKGGSAAFWKNSESNTAKYNSESSVTKIDDKTYEFTFAPANKLPGYEVYLYVTGVKDYSDNTIAKDAPVLVKANIDQSRPEVTSVELNETDYKTIVVKFSKSIANLTTRSMYSLKDAKGNVVSVRSITPSDNDKTATILLYTALEEGEHVLKIEGLKDKTTLANVMMPYETTLNAEDNGAPTVKSVAKDGRYVIITFSEEMSLDGDGSIARLENYLIQYSGGFRALPAGTSLDVMSDAKSVMLIMPAKVGTADYDHALLTAVTVQRVEDAAGNILENYSFTTSSLSSTFEISATSGLDNVKLIDHRTVELTFNQNIGTGVDAADFKILDSATSLVENAKVESVEVNGSKVLLTLDKDYYTLNGSKLSFAAEAFNSVLGTKVSAYNAVIQDKVKPELKDGVNEFVVATANAAGTATIVVPFTENLLAANEAQFATDLIVKRVNGNKLLVPTVDYTTTVTSGDEITILLENTANVNGHDSVYTVELKAPTFVVDANNNKAVEFSAISTGEVTLGYAKVKEIKTNTASSLVVEFNETVVSALGDVSGIVATVTNTDVANVVTFALSASANSAEKFQFTVTDTNGNVKTYEATFTTEWTIAGK